MFLFRLSCAIFAENLFLSTVNLETVSNIYNYIYHSLCRELCLYGQAVV